MAQYSLTVARTQQLLFAIIILNPVVGRGGVSGFWGAGQGATTRNGATAQGGAVPSEGRCDPVAGCGAITRSRHPLRCPIPASQGPSVQRFEAPLSKELQRSHVPQKLFNPPRSELTKKVKAK